MQMAFEESYPGNYLKEQNCNLQPQIPFFSFFFNQFKQYILSMVQS